MSGISRFNLMLLSPSRSPEPDCESSEKGGPQRGVYRLFYDLTRQEWFVRGAYD